MADKQIFLKGSFINWVIGAVATALGIGAWDLLPAAAIVAMVGIAVAWSVVRLVNGPVSVANRLASAELGLAISGIVIGVVANAH